MPERTNHHHHHRHRHHQDSATIFKERSLRAIVVKKMIEKWLKIFLTVVAALMMLAVIFVYMFG